MQEPGALILIGSGGLLWHASVEGIEEPLPENSMDVDPITEVLSKSTSAYERPQPHACFILSVEDDLVNEGGVMDLAHGDAVGDDRPATVGVGQHVGGTEEARVPKSANGALVLVGDKDSLAE